MIIGYQKAERQMLLSNVIVYIILICDIAYELGALLSAYLSQPFPLFAYLMLLKGFIASVSMFQTWLLFANVIGW